MIAQVTGVVAHAGLDRLVVTVGGVGLLVHTTPAAAASHRPGSEVTLHTTLVVREESLTLFGFEGAAERDMFETAQTVSGIGPRLALAMLSVMGPDDLARALSGGDTAALRKIPGVGPKSAERLVLELRDKVGAFAVGGSAASAPVASSGAHGQVEEALVGLGWSAKQAADAVAKVAGVTPGADVATLLRLSLRELGR